MRDEKEKDGHTEMKKTGRILKEPRVISWMTKERGIIIITDCDKAVFKVMAAVLDVFVWDLEKVVKRGECCNGIKKG